MRRLLREPLLHFLLIGLVLFGAQALLAPRDAGGETLVIPAQAVAALAAQHEKVWGRPPSRDELRGLVDARIAEELMYREGIALGLGQDDALIRRRVRQKYELMVEETGSRVPTDADLQRYLDAHPDKFRTWPVLSFSQVLLAGGRDASAVEVAMATARQALAAGADPAEVGEATLLPHQVQDLAIDLVARDFGAAFAEQVRGLPEGQWSGPVPSAYGLHLVRLDRVAPAAVPELARIRATVLREWESDRRALARQEHVAQLRQRYRVSVEGLPDE